MNPSLRRFFEDIWNMIFPSITCSTPWQVNIFRCTPVIIHIFVFEWEDTFISFNCVTTLVLTENLFVFITFRTSQNIYNSCGSQGQAFLSGEASIGYLKFEIMNNIKTLFLSSHLHSSIYDH